MDRITESMLAEFSTEANISSLDESDRFEHFASYATVQRLYGETFDTSDVVLGGHEAGIDAIAIIVNGVLVSDPDTLAAVMEPAASLDVTFVFVQADRSRSFNAGKMGNFVFAVRDFFHEPPQLPRSNRLTELAAMQTAIYEQSAKFKRGNPNCYLFYVTTGEWAAETTLEARRTSAIAELRVESIFSTISFECVGADVLQKLYRQSKNAIERDFTFSNQIAISDIPGVREAYLGTLPAKELLLIITSEDGEISRSIFESNIRDFQGYNQVNDAIRITLDSDHKARFVLMNNGITIIARVLNRTANRFHIEDFQVVNGCQTCNVLFEQREKVEDVVVPVRLIASDDEDVIQSIVTATNQQTQLSREQLFAATEFPKKLEQFVQTYPGEHKLYYERRSRQYDRLPIDKGKVITQANMIRAFAGMFLEEPHRTTRDFNALLVRIGKDIFVEDHRLEPYYVAGYALCKLERMFKIGTLDSKFKAARNQVLLAVRRLANPSRLPKMNAREMEAYCKVVCDLLWDDPTSTIIKASKIVEHSVRGDWNRDNIRVQPVTESIKNYPIPGTS